MIAHTPHATRGQSHSRRGNALPVVVILISVLVGMVAFAIDIGAVAHARTQLQATADAGALAGLPKLYSTTNTTPNYTSAKAEVNKFVGGSAGNMPGLAVPDSDIQFGYFDPAAAAGSRFSTDLTSRRANALRVTLRRDGDTNPRQRMYFGAILGKTQNDVLARSTAWAPQAQGMLPNGELIPYVAQIDYFNAAAGITPRASNSSGFINVATNLFSDLWNIGPVGTTPSIGPDGVREVLLYGDTQQTAGNFGSIDLGTSSNATGDLSRQLRYGPTQSDFDLMDTAGKLAADKSLQVPVTLGGDTGLSASVKSDWDAVIGQNKIIPLYDTVVGTGNTAQYHIVGFAAVRIVDSQMNGNPKKVWVQPTAFYSGHVKAASSILNSTVGVYAPPRLVIP